MAEITKDGKHQDKPVVIEWSLRILGFSIVILIVCVIVLTIQIQKKNNNISNIDKATRDIQIIVNDFKKASTADSANRLDTKEIAKGLAAIDRIEKKLDEMKEDSKK